MTIEEAIEKLEVDLKRLKVHYDMFFTGALPRQPYELRKQVEALIRTSNTSSIKKYHHRFMLNTLIGRYNTMCELWGKQLRSQEESGRAAAVAAIMQKSPHPPAPSAHDAEEVYYAVNVRHPESEQDAMKALYDQYLEARKADSSRPQIKLESFVKQISKQAESLRESTGCETIEFRVLRKGQSVSLKARANR